MSELMAKDDGTNKQFKPKIFQSKRRRQTRIFCFMTNIIIIKEIIKIGIDPVVEITEFHLVVGFSVDKNIEIEQDMDKILGLILEEVIPDVMWECIISIIRSRIIENRIIEVDIEDIIGMKTMKEVIVGPEKDNFKVVIMGVIKAQVIVDLDQVWEQVLIGIG